MWQMKATATNTRPGSMEEEPDMENKQGDNPSQHKMRGWRTAALREQGQSTGTLTNEHNTNKQKKTTLTRDIPRQARRVGKQTHNRWTKMQGEYKETIRDNLQRITQQTKKETNQRETSRAATTSWCRTHKNTNDKSGRNKSIQSPWGSCLTSHARPSAEW